MPNHVDVPEGEMATAIKALAESLGGVAVARPGWTDFEKQKERLGLAVIAVLASVQGHSDEWVKRDDLPAITAKAVEAERERMRVLADTLEEWGASDADVSDREGDVADERYKAFQMSAELIRNALADQRGDTDV